MLPLLDEGLLRLQHIRAHVRGQAVVNLAAIHQGAVQHGMVPASAETISIYKL